MEFSCHSAHFLFLIIYYLGPQKKKNRKLEIGPRLIDKEKRKCLALNADAAEQTSLILWPLHAFLSARVSEQRERRKSFRLRRAAAVAIGVQAGVRQ